MDPQSWPFEPQAEGDRFGETKAGRFITSMMEPERLTVALRTVRTQFKRGATSHILAGWSQRTPLHITWRISHRF